MWLPWIVVAVFAYRAGGAALLVLPFLFTFLVLYLVRRRVLRQRGGDQT
jgi:hypothetical protein